MAAPATVPAVHVLRFEAFELDLRAGELRKGGTRVRLRVTPDGGGLMSRYAASGYTAARLASRHNKRG